MKFAFSVTFSAQSCRDPCPYKASWPSCAASDYLPSHSRVGVRSGRCCADFDRPRPRAAMASTLPDSTSQLTSHLRQVSWGIYVYVYVFIRAFPQVAIMAQSRTSITTVKHIIHDKTTNTCKFVPTPHSHSSYSYSARQTLRELRLGDRAGGMSRQSVPGGGGSIRKEPPQPPAETGAARGQLCLRRWRACCGPKQRYVGETCPEVL